jgi:hypothetical protein
LTGTGFRGCGKLNVEGREGRYGLQRQRKTQMLKAQRVATGFSGCGKLNVEGTEGRYGLQPVHNPAALPGL